MSTIRARLMISWNFSTYTDESPYLVEASGDMRFTPLEDALTGGRGITDTMALTLSNATGRFSALNADGPLYSFLQDGKAYHAPVYLEISQDGGSYVRVFTGVIKVPAEGGVTGTQAGTVTVECRSRDELLLNKRISTPLVDFQTVHDQGYDESQIMSLWLTQAGVASGDKILDPGLNVIPWAWLDQESPLEDIWALASACGGRFYANPDGKYVYENATYWLRATRSTTVQEAINKSLTGRITPIYDDTDLYNEVTVEASTRIVSALDVLWEPDEVIVVPANNSKQVTAQLRQPVYSISGVDFAASTSGGEAITSSVSVDATYFAQRVDLTITNSHATHAAFVRPLRINGYPVSGGPTLSESRNSEDHGSNQAFFAVRGSRSKTVRGNLYVQSRTQAGAHAEFLLSRYERPRLSYKIDETPGKASRRLGDRINVRDERTMSSWREALITSIAWSYSKAGFIQNIEASDAAQLYPYQVSPGYFVIGSDAVGGSKVLFF
jgi:hypothetical protein